MEPGEIFLMDDIGPKRTFAGEDIKHILDGIDKVLNIYDNIVNEMIRTYTVNTIDNLNFKPSDNE